MTIAERIAANARFLCKYQKKNIGDMEETVGVSTGYLSRVKGKATLTVDVGYALAEFLGVSMDNLISPALAKQARIAELEAELNELRKEDDNGET